MEKTTFETILRVFDLDECRSFYTELFGRDALVVNSSFLVRFRYAGHKHLTLERAFEKTPAQTFALDLADPMTLLQKLRALDAPLEEASSGFPGGILIRTLDPDGNQLLIQCAKTFFANFKWENKTEQDITRS